MPCVYLTTNKVNDKKYIGVDTKDDPNYFGSGVVIKQSIKKYGKENFKREILESSDNVKYIFEREIYWINTYNAIESNEFYNLADGGKGGNTLNNEESIKKWEICKTSLENVAKFRKGKTYDEIYGDMSEEEKRKRRVASYGRIKSKEECEKISKSLTGNVPWNKGLTKEDNRVKRNVENRDNRKYLKIYILHNPEELTFNGKKELEIYIKTTNQKLSSKNRINVDNLIKFGIDKGYTLELKKNILT